jgi:hypothetical protein
MKVRKFFKDVDKEKIEESGCKWHLRKGEDRDHTVIIRRSRSLESVLGAHSGGPGGRRKVNCPLSKRGVTRQRQDKTKAKGQRLRVWVKG